MLIIGIVGPPAGGKSTVAAILAKHGAVWINADRLAHNALRLADVKRKLRAFFGEAIFETSGTIDRKRLGTLVFGADPTKRGSLEYIESVLHPIVFELAMRRIKRLALRQQKVVVLDAPLLIEAGWHFSCDEVWCVDSPLELRTQWIAERSWSTERLREREARQISLIQKRRHATQIIDNSGNPNQTRELIENHWIRIQHAIANANTNHC